MRKFAFIIKFKNDIAFWQQAENGCGMIPNSKQGFIVKYQKGKEQNIAQLIIETLTEELKQKEAH